MKIAVISTGMLPAPPPSYGGIEQIVANFAQEAAKQGNEVYLLTTNESKLIGDYNAADPNDHTKINGKLSVRGCAPSSWDYNSERTMFFNYRDWLEKEFGDGSGIVWDNSWWGYPYFSAKAYPKLKILHSHHGEIGTWYDLSTNPAKIVPPDLQHPRMLGVSSMHAQYLSDLIGLPLRYIHNGIDIPSVPESFPFADEGYLLSLNRISREKGILNAVDCAIASNYKIKVVGDDMNVTDQKYIYDVMKRCENSKGMAEYIGLVDTATKWELIKKCKALIATPNLTWHEAFGMYAVEANSMGKPVLALANCGLNDIVKNNENGFLSNTVSGLVDVIKKGILDHFDANVCRNMATTYFSTPVMTRNYLELFQKVLEDDISYQW